MSDAAFITAKLKTVRRRQFLILLFRCISTAVVGFVFWGLFCALGIFSPPGLSVILLLISAAATLSVCLIVSLAGMPSWKDTVKLVDKASGLQQRLETSWECIPPREEMDALLLSDTSRRIQSIRAAAVVPLQFGQTTRISLILCLLAVATLGIVLILGGRNRAYSPVPGKAPLAVTGKTRQSKNAPKANSAKNQADISGKTQPFASDESTSESDRRSSQTNLTREFENIPQQTYLQSAKQPPTTPIPDRGIANRQEGSSAAAVSSKPGNRFESERRAKDHQSGTIKGTTRADKTYSHDSVPDADASRPNAGAESIRKAERDGNGKSGSPALSKTKPNVGATLSGGQAEHSLNKQIMTGNDARFWDEYSRDYPALLFAVEQALQKEKIPPGFKKYIADYFKAIHP
jgi:hypothetical protein